MAGVGDIEKLVESLVNRGLVAPKFVGRQVGQATIESLKNLGSELSNSNALRQNSQQNINSDFAAKVAKANSVTSEAINASNNTSGVGNNPFAVGITKGGAGSGAIGQNLAVAFPTSSGYQLKSFDTGGPQKDFASQLLQNNPGTIPTINSDYVGNGNTFKSIQDLKNAILQASSSPNLVNGSL